MHLKCKRARYPKSNLAYWKSKLDHNVIRDKLNTEALEIMGWKSIVVWECELHNNAEAILENVASLVKGNEKSTISFTTHLPRLRPPSTQNNEQPKRV
jgi:G:T-mismatch repair DNA endonuclease (very short patch repair protein)